MGLATGNRRRVYVNEADAELAEPRQFAEAAE
jgi:hypothetical protein